MDKRIFILIAIIGIFFYSFTNITAVTLYGKVNSNITLSQSCASCTYENITQIIYPNSTIYDLNAAMTKSGPDFNYTFQTNLGGTYIIKGIGDLDSQDTGWWYYLNVNEEGRADPSSGESMVYIGSFLAMVLFSLLFFLISNHFKSEREIRRGQSGEEFILEKGNPALRFGFLGGSFVIAMIAIIYSRIALSGAFTGFSNVSGAFDVFYYVALTFLIIMIIFVLVSLLLSAIDKFRISQGRNPDIPAG